MDEFIATLNVEIENCEADFLAKEAEFYAAAQVSATANLNHTFERFKSVGDDLLLLLTIKEVLVAWIEEHHIADPMLVGPDGADVPELEHNPAAPVDTEEHNTAAPEETEEPNTAAPQEAEEHNTAAPEETEEHNTAASEEAEEPNTAASEVSVEDNWHQNALDPNKKD